MRTKSEAMHECQCRICGKTFFANNKRQIICSEECRAIAKREWSQRYHRRHQGEIAERRKLKLERKKLEKSKKPDTIVGKGYAERQIAKSLEMAGKVRTEL